MPDTILEIIISGLAFCRPTPPKPAANGKFEVVFIHPDKHHRLDFSIKKKKPQGTAFEYTEDLGVNSQIAVALTNGVIVDQSALNQKLLIDIVKLHPDPKMVSIKDKNIDPAKTLQTSYLLIPSNQYSVVELTSLKHSFWKYDTANQVKNLIDVTTVPSMDPLDDPKENKVGKEIKFRFTIPENEQVILTFETPIIKNYTFPFEKDGMTYTLRFDNECLDHPCINDFGYYYEVLHDSNGFEIEEVPTRPEISNLLLVSTEAACNPVQGDKGCNLLNYHLNGQC